MAKSKQLAATATIADSLDVTSQEFVGQWNRLISTTNWEKGRIIYEWHVALIEAKADVSEYSDEAWSRRVGNVSPQHVGRLRRVFERFGELWEEFDGLYWTHFQSALEWPDAEMYLEGAVQNGWSVSKMRAQRWEAIGAPANLKPRDEDIISAELDEDASAAFDSDTPATISPTLDTVRDPSGEESFGPDFGDDATGSPDDGAPFGIVADDDPQSAAEQRIRPFAELPELPEDLADAFEGFKLAILHHKMNDWKEVARDDVLGTLDALKELAVAP